MVGAASRFKISKHHDLTSIHSTLQGLRCLAISALAWLAVLMFKLDFFFKRLVKAERKCLPFPLYIEKNMPDTSQQPYLTGMVAGQGTIFWRTYGCNTWTGASGAKLMDHTWQQIGCSLQRF